MRDDDDFRWFSRLCRCCGREVQGGACECAVQPRCCACGKALNCYVETDADGVKLRTCAGCAGELAAFMVYGDEAVCQHDWRAIREAAR